jgi:hypothetical protein
VARAEWYARGLTGRELRHAIACAKNLSRFLVHFERPCSVSLAPAFDPGIAENRAPFTRTSARNNAFGPKLIQQAA